MKTNEMLNFQKNALLGNIAGVPLCAEYTSEWRKCKENKEALVKLVMRQQSLPFFIHACYNGMGLSKEYIKKNFTNFINGAQTIKDADMVQGYTYELFVDYGDYLGVNSDIVAMLWCKDMDCLVRMTKAPIFYIGCGSEVTLNLEGYNSPMIYLFDNSKVTIEDADEHCNILVYKYSKDAEVEVGKYCLGKVKVFDKELKL